MNLHKISETFIAEIDGTEYRVNVPMNIDNMIVQRTDGSVVPKFNKIWKDIYDELDRR